MQSFNAFKFRFVTHVAIYSINNRRLLSWECKQFIKSNTMLTSAFTNHFEDLSIDSLTCDILLLMPVSALW